jgi:hypothetical protein
MGRSSQLVGAALALLLTACPSSDDDDAEPTPAPEQVDEELYVHGLTQPWPRLRLNEFMADNGGVVLDPTGQSADWIELVNPLDEPVNLLGWTLTDDPQEPDKHELDDLEIPAAGYLLLWADDDAPLGPHHLRFALDSHGEALGLYAPDGTTLDLLTFGSQAADIALARLPDGVGPWALTAAATPGAANEPAR